MSSVRKSFAGEVQELVDAGFGGLYVLTGEPFEAQRELYRLCVTEGWGPYCWDIGRGLRDLRKPEVAGTKESQSPVYPCNLAVIPNGGDAGEERRLVLLHNYHRFLDNPQVLQCLLNSLEEGKGVGVTYVILSRVLGIPPEAESVLRLVEHLPPDEKQLTRKANALLERDENTPVESAVLRAAAGLTLGEAENAFALSIHTAGEDDPPLRAEVVWDHKTQAIKKLGYLHVERGTAGFNSLGGLEGLKSFARKLLRPDCPVTPRGVLLLGPPGTGKSAWSRCLGHETGRPVLRLDLGAVYQKHVGDSEGNIRQALSIADSMSPAILFVDEAEKGLAGLGGEGDSGVSSRVFGSLLTWLSDHQTDVFVVMTSNDVSKLPPEFSRAERFDGVFLIDLPDKEERSLIWKMYGEAFGLAHDQQYVVDGSSTFSDEKWTGAEIKTCCRLAYALGESLEQASRRVVPVAVTAADRVEALREWASGRVLSARTGEKYRKDEASQQGAGAKVRTITKRLKE